MRSRDFWEIHKLAKKEKKRKEKEIAMGLYQVIDSLYEEKLKEISENRRLAVQYRSRHLNNHGRTLSYRKAFRFFTEYIKTRDSKERVGVYEFAERARVTPASVNRILDRMKLPTIGFWRVKKP